MTVERWLKNAAGKLADVAIATARLDSLVLLEDATGKDRAWLLAHPEHQLMPEQTTVLNDQVQQRAIHTPLSFIRHKTEFHGREFYIDNTVLEPRPESETMIDLLKKLAKGNETIIDVGTGSGALAITAQLELPDSTVFAVDIDPACLEVADKNARAHKVKIIVSRSNLIQAVAEQANDAILLCNLPYVPDSHTINQAAMFEPKIAIFGGPGGLDLYRELFEQIKSTSARPRFILTESLPFQHPALAKLAKAHGYRQQQKDDFIQAFTPPELH